MELACKDLHMFFGGKHCHAHFNAKIMIFLIISFWVSGNLFH